MKTTAPKAKKGIAAFFTGILAAIGLIEKEPKTEKERVEKEYKKTKRKNIDFVENLESTKRYSKAAIVTLAKYKEEDPDFAYELSKVFKTNRDTDTFHWNLDDSEYLAEKFKENPDLVQQYNSHGPEEAATILRAKELAPEIADELYKTRHPDTVLDYAQIYQKNPQAAIKLSQNKELYISGEDAATIAENWDKNEGAFDAITNAVKTAMENNYYDLYLSDSIVELIDTYHLYPEAVTSMILEGHNGAEKINTLAEAKTKAPKYCEMGLTESQSFENLEEIKEFALNAQKLDKQITQIEKKRGQGYGIQHSIPLSLSEMKPIVEEFKDKPEALDKIIEEGKIDTMIKATVDPVGKFFFDKI